MRSISRCAVFPQKKKKTDLTWLRRNSKTFDKSLIRERNTLRVFFLRDENWLPNADELSFVIFSLLSSLGSSCSALGHPRLNDSLKMKQNYE